MSAVAFTSIEALPRLLQLVVGLLGLIFSIKGRSKGVSGLMVSAFAVMLVTTAAGIAWQFVASFTPSWAASTGLRADEIRLIFLGVGLPLDAAAALSWLLVVLAVVKGGRPTPQPGVAPYPGPYPMAAPPGYGQLGHPPVQQPPTATDHSAPG